MADNINTTPDLTTTDTTTTTPDADNGSRKPYATIEEANANKPANAKRVRLHRVTRPNGTTAFIWSANTVESMALVAREDGYTSSSAGTQVSADKVKDGFANLSDADKLAIIGSLPPELLAKLAPPAPVALPADQQAPKGKGKGKGSN